MPHASPAEYEILPLSAADQEEVAAFNCGNADLDDFVRSDALALQECHVVSTYVARCKENRGVTLVGYIALLADAIVLQTPERKKLNLAISHPIVPALKIARLGVTLGKQRGGGIGTTLIAFAHSAASRLSETVGCRLLTVDANADSVDFYERLGFVHNRAKEYRGRERPSMRLDLYAPKPPAWL